ncbi:MAG TPA: hypothetical protein VFQ74_02935 [Pseudolysinimonas sp.]|nr:hypothetical protein [Pseudolysinimonas sp.]
MTAPSTLDRHAVSAAADARRRKQRRRVIGFWVSIAAMLFVIATVVVLALGFNNSWWVKANPIASHDQVASDGSSTFNQAGIDFSTRTGAVDITMSSARPSAAALGLADSGARHLDFLVPLTVTAKAAHAVTFTDADGLDVITAGGKVSAVEIRPTGAYAQMLGDVSALASQVGWSSDAVAQFQADLITDRQKNHGDTFTATIGPAATTGMRVSAALSGDARSAPELVIRLDAAR